MKRNLLVAAMRVGMFALLLSFFPQTKLSAQQLPNVSFEDWSGAEFDGNIQPASWNYSNVTQFGFKFNFAHRESGHTGSYAMMVQDQEVGAAGITEVSPGYVALGQPWVYIESLTKVSEATAGTSGGIAFTYRPDTMQVWIKRTGGHTADENYNIVFYSWKGTAQGTSYKGKNGECTSHSETDEESDIRQKTDGNECTTSVYATQCGEGWIKERVTYSDWTLIKIPIKYLADDKPEKCNVIFSAGNYPNFRANSGLYDGNSLYVDDVQLIYSSKVHELYLNDKKQNGFNPNEEEYTFANQTAMPSSVVLKRSGRTLVLGTDYTITKAGSLDGEPMIIVVQAEDGSSTTTYKINVISTQSTNSHPASISVNGTPISGYSGYLTSYNVVLPYGTTTTPVVTAEKAEDVQTITITQPASVSGTATIVCTAQSGAKSTYTLNFSVAKLSDNTLQDIKVNGESLTGFASTRVKYTVELPLGTTAIPTITPVSAYAVGEQTIVVNNPTAFVDDKATCTISVTTPGNTTPKVYTINYVIKASSYAYLKDILLDGVSLSDFTYDRKNYSVYLPIGTSTYKAVTYVKGDEWQTVTPTTEDGTTTIVVVAGDGTTTFTYKVVQTIQKSTVTYLNDLKLNGTTIPGFDPETYNYTYEFPLGTSTATPLAITWTPGDEYQTVAITANGGYDKTSYITVTAQSGDAKVYVVTCSVAKATDATLKMIYVDGVELAGFAPTTLEYNYEVAMGVSTMPAVTYDQHDAYQTVTPNDAVNKTTLTGDYKLTVKPQEGSSQVYIIHFTKATSSNTKLAAIFIDGVALADFVPETETYTVNLPSGSTDVPTITWTAGDAYQTVTLSAGSSLEEPSYLIVKATDGSTRTYTLNFVVTKSTNANLSDLTVGGVTIAGFSPDKYDYEYTLTTGKAFSKTNYPVKATKGESSQKTPKVTYTTSTKTVTVLVTAEDGITTQTYTIVFKDASEPGTKSNNAQLAGISVGGVALPGFAATTYSYSYTLDPGTSVLPAITWTLGESHQTVVKTEGGVNGTTTLKVTAEDGTTTQTYSIAFSTTALSTICTLASLSIDGTPVAEFASETIVYNKKLARGTSAVPAVTYTLTDAKATAVTNSPASVPCDYTITVTAESGAKKTYTIHFTVEASSNAQLAGIALDGVALSNFLETTYSYNVTLAPGTKDVPVVSYTAGDEWQNITLTQAPSTSGTATIVVQSEDTTNTNTYKVNFSVEKASVSTLLGIQVGGVGIDGFDPDKLSYDILLPRGTSSLPEITYTPHDTLQTITKVEGGISGTTKITVVAQTGDKSVYELRFKVEASSNGRLAGISIDGTPIATFEPSSTEYSIALPVGTTEVPVVTFTQGDEWQTVTLTKGTLETGSTIQVVSEDKTQSTAYKLTYNVAKAGVSTLLGIQIGGEDLPGFASETFEYSYELPVGTTILPAITVTKNDEWQTVKQITDGVNGDATIVVTAQNGASSTYTIHFSVKKSSNSLLADLKVGTKTIDNFRSDIFTYSYSLQASATSLPSVTWTLSEKSQSAEYTPASDLDGISRLVVAAEDGTYSVYTIQFVHGKNTNTNLLGLSVGGKSVEGFSPTTYVYYVNLPVGTTVMPEITYTPSDATQTITPIRNTLQDTSYVVVLAQSGASATYKIVPVVEKSTNTQLTNIWVDGKKVDGYNPSIREYAIELSASLTALPAITYEKAETAQEVSLHLGGLIGDTKLTVRSESGNEADYVLHFSQAKPSAADLDMIYLDGVELAKFVPTTYDYSYALLTTALKCPVITVKKQNEKQTVYVSSPKLDGTASIYVTSADGAEHQTYTLAIDFASSESSNSQLDSLLVNGQPIAGFAPTTLSYTLDWAQTASLPTISYVGAEPTKQTIHLSWRQDTAYVKVIAFDESSSLYSIAFQRATSLSDNAQLSSILLNGVKLNSFNAGKTTYTYPLDKSAKSCPVVEAVAGQAGQTITITQPALAGTASIHVTSEDGSSENTYTINFTKTASSNSNLSAIKVGGSYLFGFASGTYHYTYELANGTTVLPDIEPTLASDQTDSVVYGGVNGETRIFVKAEDGSRSVYTIAFSVKKSNNANLQSLTIGGVNLPIKSSQPYALPVGTKACPEVIATAEDAAAIITMSKPGLAGKLTILVTAEDGTSQNTYEVDLTATLSSDATLEGIAIDGVSVPSFSASKYNYIVDRSNKDIPAVTFTKRNGQTVVLVDNEIDGAKLLVVAEDGTTATYTITYNVAPSTNCSLSDLQVYNGVNFVSLTGFAADNYSYSYDLVRHTAQVPSVYAKAGDDWQTITITYGAPDAATTIHVVAEDGIHSQDYTITFPVAKSNDSKLSDVYRTDGETLGTPATFDPATLTYSDILLDYSVRVTPTLEWVVGDADQQVTYTSAPIGTPSTLVVRAEDGTEQTYTFDFKYDYPGDNSLKSITLSTGKIDLTTDPSKVNYTVDVPYKGSLNYVTCEKMNTAQQVLIQEGGLLHNTVVTVRTSGQPDKVYTITPNVTFEYTPAAALTGITVDGTAIPDFKASQMRYVVNVSAQPSVVVGTPADGVSVTIQESDLKHCMLKAEKAAEIEFYYIYYYYTNDTIPNTDFSCWTNAAADTDGDKPCGWTVPADVATNYSWGAQGKVYAKATVLKGDSNEVKLVTEREKNLNSIDGSLPGMMTLGSMKMTLASSGGSTSSVSGGIPFRNTPDTLVLVATPVSAQLRSLTNGADMPNWRMVVSLNGSDNVYAGSYASLTKQRFTYVPDYFALSDPLSTLNITLNSANSEQASDFSGGLLGVGNPAYTSQLNIHSLTPAFNSKISSIQVGVDDATKNGNDFTYALPDPEDIFAPQLTIEGEVADQMPVVSWTTPAANTPCVATIRNYAEDGSYTVHTLSLTHTTSNNSKLSTLVVGGVSLDVNTTDQTVNVPFGTTVYSDIQATPASVYQSIALSQAANVATIVVTAEDGSTTTYTITFVESKSAEAKLASLNIDGFASDTYTYTNLASIPSTIEFTRLTDGQTVVVAPNKVSVVAEDGTSKAEYTFSKKADAVSGLLAEISCTTESPVPTTDLKASNAAISFSRESAAAVVTETITASSVEIQVVGDATTTYPVAITSSDTKNTNLQTLQVNGAEVANYNLLNAFSLESAQDSFIYIQRGVVGQTIDASYAANKVDATVTAVDGTTTRNMSLSFAHTKKTNTQLGDLRINGATLALTGAGYTADKAFDPAETSYTITLPVADPKVAQPALPSIVALPTDSAQTISITMGALNAQTEVKVTAEDGSDNTYYLTINAEPSHNASLSTIVVDGKAILLEADKYDYEMIIDGENTPIVTYTSEDRCQSYTPIINKTKAIIEVTAEDATTKQTYTLTFTPSYSEKKLANLLVDGYSLTPAFNPSTMDYEINLPAGTTILPMVKAVAGADDQTIEIYSNGVGDYTTISVTSRDTKTKEYSINFLVDETDATLRGIAAFYESVPDFVPSNDTYSQTLAEAPTKDDIQYRKAADGQIVEVNVDDAAKQYTLSVTSADGTNNFVYVVNYTVATVSSADQLTNIELDGKTIAGFATDTYTYDVALPDGTTILPVITGVRDDKRQELAFASTDVASPATISVTTPAGTVGQTYTINFTAKKSSDATLKMIYADGADLVGYDPLAGTYAFNLAMGTRVFPSLTYAKNDADQIVVTTVDSTDAYVRKTTYDVTAPDGIATMKYEVTYTIEKSNNVAIDILVATSPEKTFSPVNTGDEFLVDLAAGTTSFPGVWAKRKDDYQTVLVTDQLLDEGRTQRYTFSVTAESGATAVYYLNLNRSYSTINTLADLLVNGHSIAQKGIGYTADKNFAANQHEYSLTWAVGSSVLPTFGCIRGDENEYIAPSETQQLTDWEGDVVFNVIAQDGVQSSTYTIHNHLLLSDNIYLRMLYSDGVELTGFDSATFAYTITLPVGTRVFPVVNWLTGDKFQKVDTVWTRYSTYKAQCNILVTAQDGSQGKYTITYNVKQSSIAELENILVDGETLARSNTKGYTADYDFSPERTEYHITWPIGSSSPVPEMSLITYTLGEYQRADSTRYHSLASLSDTWIMTIVAEDNHTEKRYTVYSELLHSYTDTLQMLYVEGKPVNNFDPHQLTYQVVLPVGTASFPIVTWEKGESYQTVDTIWTRSGLEASCQVVVHPESGDVRTYVVNMQICKSGDASLSNLTIGSLSIARNGNGLGYTADYDFAPDQFVYNIEWAVGTTALPEIAYTLSSAHAKVVENPLTSLDGQYKLEITAENDSAKATYVINSTLLHDTISWLLGVQFDGKPYAYFDADTLSYEVTLPAFSSLPEVTWTLGSPNQQVDTVWTRFTRGGTCLLSVKPDLGAVRTYTFHFTIAKSSNTQLADIRVNGMTISQSGVGYTSPNDFAPARTVYNLTFDDDGAMPVVEFVPAEPSVQLLTNYGATASVLPASTITTRVTAENGDTAVYSVSFHPLSAIGNKLDMIYINEEEVPDFDSEIASYSINLPSGTDLSDMDVSWEYDEETLAMDVMDDWTYIDAYNAICNVVVTPLAGSLPEFTYTLVLSVEKSAVSTLNSIKIDLIPMMQGAAEYSLDSAFRKDLFEYNILWNIGTTALPTFTVGKGNKYQSVSPESVTLSSLDETVTFTVIAENGNLSTYVVHNTLAHSSCDTLKLITYNGDSIRDFEPSVATYFDTLPQGSTPFPEGYPTIDYIRFDDDFYSQVASSWMLIDSCNAMCSVVVTPEDPATPAFTYSLNFTIERDSNNALGSIFVNGSAISGFMADSLIYDYVLPEHTDSMPTIKCYGSSNQTITIYPGGVSGPTLIFVKAEDGSERTYQINFSVRPCDNAYLHSLLVDGVPVSSWDSTELTYSVSLPAGSTELPAVTYELSEPLYQVASVQVSGLTATVTVVAIETGNTLVYTINGVVPALTDASLSAILLDSVLIDGFRPDSFDYVYTLPYGSLRTDSIQIQWILSDSTKQTLDITSDSGAVRMADVTAEDGITINTYTVTIKVALCSNDSLELILLNGDSLEGWKKEQVEYVIAYPEGTPASQFAVLDSFTFILADSTAHIDTIQVNDTISEDVKVIFDGKERHCNVTLVYSILISAQDGSRLQYTIKQGALFPSNALLANIFADSVALPDFDPNKFDYTFYVFEGMPAPEFTALAQDSTADVAVTSGKVGETTLIFCTALDGTENIYNIKVEYSPIKTNQTATANNVLWKHIPDSKVFGAYSSRKGVQVAVFTYDGRLVFYQNVPSCAANGTVIENDGFGQETLVSVDTTVSEGAYFEVDKFGEIYFYAFFYNKKKIASGKFSLVQ